LVEAETVEFRLVERIDDHTGRYLQV